YGFNGKEKDNEMKGDGNSYDFDARIYDPRLGRWLATDPRQIKYPSLSPYHFGYNNPIITIDPNGMENIVVTGGEYTSDTRYKYNFVESAIKQIKDYQVKDSKESTTWAVMNVGYSPDEIELMQNTAKSMGVGFVLINSAKELSNYINSKTTTSSVVSKERKADKVTDVSLMGHGFVGSAEFGYHQGDEAQEKFSFGDEEVKLLDPTAFDNGCIDFYTCNAGTPLGKDQKSLAEKVADQTKTKTTGFHGKSDYKYINQGEGIRDKVRRFLSGFDIFGSEKLPQGGMKNDKKSSSEKKTFDKREKKSSSTASF
ncbi:MAG: RHS repeat-associated core domain-containing protein, partial [Bacteroidota bacterium]|nr:RHS repeat-associated core domain-containing protein [Bacteroidota bacterium]